MRWGRRRTQATKPELVKVGFELEPADGWPPVGGESLWAFSLGDNRYRLDNTPWFVRGVSCYDVVEAAAGEDGGVPVVERVIERSGHLTVRVLPLGDRSADALEALTAEFNDLGVDCEGDQVHGLLALDIPPGARLAPIKDHLKAGEAAGRWEYEEGLVNDLWLAM